MTLHTNPEDRPEHAAPARPPRKVGALLASAIGVAVVLGAYGLRYADRALFAPAPSGPPPVIGADQGPVKEQPKDRGGMVVPGQNMIILNGDAARPKVEQLLPPPETPLASPRPPQAAQAAAPPTPQQQAAVPAVAPSPPQAAAPKPQPAPAVPAAKPTPPAVPPQVASAPPSLGGLPGSKGGWYLQLGSVRSQEAAQAEWTRLKSAQPDLLGALAANSARVDLGPDKGVYYRIVAGPIADQSAATRTCSTLKQRNVACILLKP